MRVLVYIIFFFTFCIGFSQQNAKGLYVDASYYYGALQVTNKNVAHLVRNQPSGILLSFNNKTFGERYWQEQYGYPDWGFTVGYQDFGNDVLDKSFIAYSHVNFYFLERNLQLKLAQGIGITTAPFNYEDNFKNNAYGSTLIASTLLGLQYHRERIFKGLGFQAGLLLVHHSNGSWKAPNSGTNLIAASLGLLYNFDKKEGTYISNEENPEFREPIRVNVFLRTGINEGETVGLGQEPFLVLGTYLDKRLSFKSSVQFGAEVFFSKFLQNEIKFESVSFFNSSLADTDYKRVGVFVGHELHLSRFSIPVQLGYYVYWPYEYELPFYERIGVKYYIKKNMFATFSIKAHAVNAEAVEFGFGVRL